jgi:hypothetical protein
MTGREERRKEGREENSGKGGERRGKRRSGQFLLRFSPASEAASAAGVGASRSDDGTGGSGSDDLGGDTQQAAPRARRVSHVHHAAIHKVHHSRQYRVWATLAADALTSAAARQGLTLVHISAQCKRCWWDRGCLRGM